MSNIGKTTALKVIYRKYTRGVVDALAVGRVVLNWQIVDFTGQQPMKDAFEGLSNINGVTVTWEEVITAYDDFAGTLELRYNVTFDGDCVRGNIPTGALAESCYASATDVLADVDCRCCCLAFRVSLASSFVRPSSRRMV